MTVMYGRKIEDGNTIKIWGEEENYIEIPLDLDHEEKEKLIELLNKVGLNIKKLELVELLSIIKKYSGDIDFIEYNNNNYKIFIGDEDEGVYIIIKDKLVIVEEGNMGGVIRRIYYWHDMNAKEIYKLLKSILEYFEEWL